MSAGHQRARATFWLLEARDSLREQSHRNPDGTGLGFYDIGGMAHVHKRPLAAFDDDEFAREARTVESSTFVAHVRFASTGAKLLRNTHPFEQRGRLFAHNGVVEDLPRLEEELGDDRELVAGETDSERLFALITREIEARGGDVGAGITAAATWVADNLALFSINFVLITADELWALRYPEGNELFVLQCGAAGGAGDGVIERRSSLGTRVATECAGDQAFVVVASERMDEDPGWRPLRVGELVRVGPDLHVSSEVIIERAPAHLLTLEDLHPTARSSQSAATPGSPAA